MKKGKPVIINTFRGLGDIIFAMPLYRHLIKIGHTIIHPYLNEFDSIWKHFPEITWIPKQLLNIDYEDKRHIVTRDYDIIPLRWSDQIMKVPFADVMKAKYDMLGLDYNMWRGVTWVRDIENEKKLMNHFGIKPGEKYIIVNNTFRTDKTGKVNINIKTNIQTIRLSSVPGFTLFDWGMLLEGASEIHTVGTSINYIIDPDYLKVTCPVHLYVRRPEEQNFNFYNYLLKKQYIYHP